MNQILHEYDNAMRITQYNRVTGRILRAAKEVVVWDTETTGLLFHTPTVFHDNDDKEVDNPFPFGISLCFPYKNRLVMAWGRWGTDLYKACKDILATDAMKIAHNMKYDLRVCKTNGIPVNGDQHCTLTMSRIYWDRRKSHSLQALSEFVCPYISDWEVNLKKELTKLKTKYSRAGYPKDYVNYSFLADEMIGKYSMTDTFMVWQLAAKLFPIMQDRFPELYERERNVVDVVMKIEENGMGYDAKRGRREIKKIQPRIDEALTVMRELSPPDFTLHPPKIIHALKLLGVTEKQLKEKGKVTTEVGVLERCLKEDIPKRAKRFVKSLLDYRAWSKVAGTYLKPLTEMAERTGGVVYTSINPTDSRTGRPASRDPNLLNIPNPEVKGRGRKNSVRACFVPREGRGIYYFDVSQQEMAVFGLYAKDYRILEAYARGEDLHQYMADALDWSDKRKIVKNLNFAVIYGTGIKHMAVTWGVTIDRAKEIMAMYHEEFPTVREFQERCKYELIEKGYVEDPFGRRYHVPVGQAYKAVNASVQGGCAQAFKMGLLNVSDSLMDCERIILPVYDEIQIERPVRTGKSEISFCKQIIKQMTDIPPLLDRGLKLRVDVAKTMTNWEEKKKLEIA